MGLLLLLGLINLKLSLDKTTFFKNEDILLHINIKNESNKPVYIFLPDRRYLFLRIYVKDIETGKFLEPKIPEWTLSIPSVLKEVDFISGESIYIGEDTKYVLTVNLKTIFSLKPGNEYWVSAKLLKDVRENTSDFIISQNILYFEIRKQKLLKPREKTFKEEITITPKEIVRLFLEAEKEKNFKDYLKFIYYDEFIKLYPYFASKYYEKGANKEEILQEFKEFLTKPREDYIIKYRIIRERTIDPKRKEVEALVLRNALPRPIWFKYRFKLIKYKDFYLIYSFDVSLYKRE